MFKKIQMIIGALALMGLGGGQAIAASIFVAEGNDIFTNGAPTVDLTIRGDFTGEPTEAGGLTVSFDANVLLFDTFASSALFDAFVTDDDPLDGLVEFIFLFNSGGPLDPAVEGVFDIGVMSFNVAGNQGDFTDVLLSDSCDFCEWLGPDLSVINVDFQLPERATTVTVSAVPVPPAVWLFGSGLLGLVGIARRRSAHSP